MPNLSRAYKSQPGRRRIARFAALAAAAFVPQFAFAGTCPAGKFGANVRPPVSTPASGVTDTVIASIIYPAGDVTALVAGSAAQTK